MRCKFCGSSMDDNDVFCPVCGRNVNDSIETVTVSGPENKTSEEKNALDGIAISSFILGLISLICCGILTAPSGIILACFGMKSEKKTLAIIGLILSILALLIWVAIFAVGLITGITSGVYSEMYDQFMY